MSSAVEFVTPNFEPGELETVNSLEFTRALIVELIGKLNNTDESTFPNNFSQLVVAINSYKNLLVKYGSSPALLAGAQLLFEEVIYNLQELITIYKNGNFRGDFIQELEELLNANTF